MTLLTFEHSPSTYLRLLKWHRLTCISITATTVGVVYTISKLQRAKLKNLKQIRTKNWFLNSFHIFCSCQFSSCNFSSIESIQAFDRERQKLYSYPRTNLSSKQEMCAQKTCTGCAHKTSCTMSARARVRRISNFGDEKRKKTENLIIELFEIVSYG